jgi:hypothetical protein
VITGDNLGDEMVPATRMVLSRNPRLDDIGKPLEHIFNLLWIYGVLAK